MDATPNPASSRLAVYGSLAPGESNHHVLACIAGTWRRGWVEGDLHAEGWGAPHGYPGLVWRRSGPRCPVSVMESQELDAHWERLDAFEGSDYRRIVVPVFGLSGNDESLASNIYVIRSSE